MIIPKLIRRAFYYHYCFVYFATMFRVSRSGSFSLLGFGILILLSSCGNHMSKRKKTEVVIARARTYTGTPYK